MYKKIDIFVFIVEHVCVCKHTPLSWDTVSREHWCRCSVLHWCSDEAVSGWSPSLQGVLEKLPQQETIHFLQCEVKVLTLICSCFVLTLFFVFFCLITQGNELAYYFTFTGMLNTVSMRALDNRGQMYSHNLHISRVIWCISTFLQCHCLTGLLYSSFSGACWLSQRLDIFACGKFHPAESSQSQI